MGTLSQADGEAFGMLAELVATGELVALEKSAPGFAVLVTDATGGQREHPALRLERATAAALRPYLERFGLDPVGRARLTVTPAGAGRDKSRWAGLLA